MLLLVSLSFHFDRKSPSPLLPACPLALPVSLACLLPCLAYLYLTLYIFTKPYTISKSIRKSENRFYNSITGFQGSVSAFYSL
jgi:hypothetical protein